MKQYSVTQARDQLSKVVDEIQTGGPVEITRRGKPVVVFLSFEEYERWLDAEPRDGGAPSGQSGQTTG